MRTKNNKAIAVNFFTILTFLLLIGCVGSFQKMDRWMGVSESVLLSSLGVPTFVEKIASQALKYSWDRHPQWDESCHDEFLVKRSVVVSYSSNCGLWGGAGVPSPSTPNTE
jgi:hypothetical protein